MAFKFVKYHLSFWSHHKKIIHIIELLDKDEQDTEFWFRRLEFNNAYLNKSSFKCYISILWGGSEAILILLI